MFLSLPRGTAFFFLHKNVKLHNLIGNLDRLQLAAWVLVPRALRISPRRSRKQNPSVGAAPRADRRRSQLGALLARPGSPGRAKGLWWWRRQAAQLCYE